MLVAQNQPANAGSIPVLGRSPGGGNSNPLQYSCLENPMDRGAWHTAVHGVAKSQTRLKLLSTQSLCYSYRVIRTYGLFVSGFLLYTSYYLNSFIA